MRKQLLSMITGVGRKHSEGEMRFCYEPIKPINVAVLYFVVCIVLMVGSRALSAVMHQNQSITTSESSPIGQRDHGGKPAKDEYYSELVNRVHQLVNEFRRQHGLKRLKLDPVISAQAREHSIEMAREGNTISHRGFKQRLQDIGKKIPFRVAAENVAASIGHENPAQTAVEGWKTSPEHRKNMLGNFSLTGIGVAQSKDGGYFFTQIFLEPIEPGFRS